MYFYSIVLFILCTQACNVETWLLTLQIPIQLIKNINAMNLFEMIFVVWSGFENVYFPSYNQWAILLYVTRIKTLSLVALDISEVWCLRPNLLRLGEHSKTTKLKNNETK